MTQRKLPSVSLIPSRKPKSCMKLASLNTANYTSETTSNFSDSSKRLILPHINKNGHTSKFKQVLNIDHDLSLSNEMEDSDSVSNFSDSVNDNTSKPSAITQSSKFDSTSLNNMLKNKSKGTSEILTMIFNNNYDKNKKSKLTGALSQDRYKSIRDAPKENVVTMS
mmetsp:Transcript_10923/g.10827  ORF Transcript_10923/g.10827 Transcript_10923/m.10827 type:complete len:166 (-) Transcript_10923:219-716(-)